MSYDTLVFILAVFIVGALMWLREKEDYDN